MENNKNNNHIQANVDEIVGELSQQIASLSTENAVFKSLINQYKKKVAELEQTQSEVIDAD